MMTMRLCALFFSLLASLGDTVSSTNQTMQPILEENNKNSSGYPLVVFVEFTVLGSAINSYDLQGRPTSVAFSHLAAAQLAVDHFNTRDSSVVPEMDALTHDCNVQIESLIVADTGTTSVTKFLIGHVDDGMCAIAGPFGNIPTLEAAVVASGLEIPVVSHGADDTRLSSHLYPYAMQTSLNLHSHGEAILNFLRHHGRTNFLATVFVTNDFGKQSADTIENAARESNFTHLSRYQIAPPFTGFEPNRSIRYALHQIKQSTYRTIIVATHHPEEIFMHVLADAAEEYKMNGDDYVWVFTTPLALNLGAFVDGAMSNSNATKLLTGAAFIRTLDGFDSNRALGQVDPFLESWKQLDTDFGDRVNALVPLVPNQPGYYQAEANYFQTHFPQQSSGFMYDAVMTAGLGKCLEEETWSIVSGNDRGGQGDDGEDAVNRNKKKRRRIKGKKSNAQTHRRRVQKQLKKFPPPPPPIAAMMDLKFTGATGNIEFKEGRRPRNRNRNKGVTWGAYNIREISEKDKAINPNYTLWYYLSDVLQGGPVSGTWTETKDGPFIFADGSTNPPVLLRDTPNQNYLSAGVRILGLVLMSISIFLSCKSAAFVYWHREENVIKQSQPVFLHLLLIGAVIISSSIFTLSFDEGQGWDDSMLDSACTAFPWLLSLGYITIYSALFMKMWRINQVLQPQRRIVKAAHVTPPFIILLLSAVVVLSVWTALSPLTWERKEIDADTGETYGRCRSEHDNLFIGFILVLMATPTFITVYMAWKTVDVDDRLSESSWIFYTIVLQCQVIMVGIPILVILEDASTDATYIGRVLLIWSIPMSSVLLIFVPKVVKVLLPSNKISSTRGSVGRTQVTGLSDCPVFVSSSGIASDNASSRQLGSANGSAIFSVEQAPFQHEAATRSKA